jgi:VIT1/CCC1 family predicted Fe2+/Mn2+ transporter
VVAGKKTIMKKLYLEERLHESVYSSLSKSERSPEIKKIMADLAVLEKKHGNLWRDALNEPISEEHIRQQIKIKTAMILALRHILGLAFTIKIIEHTEGNLHNALTSELKRHKASKREERDIEKVRKSEEEDEDYLETRIINFDRFFKNVRDIMFGMNDGLVELLAVVVGLAAAIETPSIVFIAGFIVAIAGTLSMGVGAYLSTDYQEKIGDRAGNSSKRASALSSGLYVGIFYFIGTLFPLSPFIFGISGYIGIIIAIIVTAAVLTFTSATISLVSDKSVIKGILKTLVLSLGVAAITIMLGAYIRGAYHVSI